MNNSWNILFFSISTWGFLNLRIFLPEDNVHLDFFLDNIARLGIAYV